MFHIQDWARRKKITILRAFHLALLIMPFTCSWATLSYNKAEEDTSSNANSELNNTWSETTLNYRMMVERYPNLKEEVGSSVPAMKISSLLEGKLARWSTASCALALACRHSVSKKERKN
jgi:hypothetical protein